jgi:LmbE family N-acetylglucosaminyl deacetylase
LLSEFEGARRVLVLAPHTDDGEFGCGGTIARLVRGGAEVYYAAFSLAEESVPPPFPKNILEVEVKAATRRLGIDPERLLLYRYRVRHFAHHRQEILEDLVRLSRDLAPGLVLMPCLHDIHQDHTTVAAEGVRAFKRTSILAYEMPWNHLTFATQGFVTLGEEDLEMKIAALECYESQRHRNYASAEFVRSLAITRGTQIGQRYAEAFEVIRWVL